MYTVAAKSPTAVPKTIDNMKVSHPGAPIDLQVNGNLATINLNPDLEI